MHCLAVACTQVQGLMLDRLYRVVANRARTRKDLPREIACFTRQHNTEANDLQHQILTSSGASSDTMAANLLSVTQPARSENCGLTDQVSRTAHCSPLQVSRRCSLGRLKTVR